MGKAEVCNNYQSQPVHGGQVESTGNKPNVG